MSENLTGAFVRRRELTCTMSELEQYGSKILLENEVLYVRLESGAIALKIGDGVTPISDLPLQTNLPQIADDDNGKVLMADGGLWVPKSLSSLEYLGHVSVTVSKETYPDAMYYLGDDVSQYPDGEYANSGSGIRDLMYNADMLVIQLDRNYHEEHPIFIGGVGESYTVGSNGQIAGVNRYGGYYLAKAVGDAIFCEYAMAETVDFYAYKLPKD